jgi:hypothetical protein
MLLRSFDSIVDDDAVGLDAVGAVDADVDSNDTVDGVDAVAVA